MNVYKGPAGEQQIPPGCSKETITVWNYSPPKFSSCDFHKQKIVGNRPSILKHNGMKSENQREFIVPVPKKFNWDVRV